MPPVQERNHIATGDGKMIRVVEYTENIDHIRDSYNFRNETPHQEFEDIETVTIKFVVSGVSPAKAREFRAALTKLGFAP
jgi:hypothetical protein